jgi:uncharacterized protein YcfJ
MEQKMKILTLAAATALLASQTLAGSYETRCTTQSVPYEEVVRGGSPENVLGGAIIGGLLGKAATGDDGAAAIGAIIGGAVANERSSQTVTRYEDVETCTNVFVPDRITDEDELKAILRDLNAGRTVSRETTMDVQYTIGVSYDGKWGPKSRAAAAEYLAGYEPDAPSEPAADEDPGLTLYSLMVNDVVVVSSPDVAAIDQIKKALAEAGVDSAIFVDLQ